MRTMFDAPKNVEQVTTSKSFISPKKQENVFFQPKLTVGPTDDAYEREADAVADNVMSMQDHHLQTKMSPVDIQRKCSKCEEEEKAQRSTRDKDQSTNSEAPSQVGEALNTSGESMDHQTQSFMENRFGYDFSHVKIHTGTVAAKSADSINALAYTSGSSIVFNEGQYQPGTESGKRLLAHELTHTIQQGGTIKKKEKSEVVQRQQARPRTRTIWLNIGFDSSAVANTETMRRIRASIAAEQAAINHCCTARETGCNIRVRTLYDWNRVNKPAPADGDYDGDVAADRNLRQRNIDNIDTGRAGGIRILVTNSTISQTWQGVRIFANANSGNDNLLWNVDAPTETFPHETGHIAGYSAGDIEGGHHHSDPDNIMSRGNIRNAGAVPDENWCDRVSALAV